MTYDIFRPVRFSLMRYVLRSQNIERKLFQLRTLRSSEKQFIIHPHILFIIHCTGNNLP